MHSEYSFLKTKYSLDTLINPCYNVDNNNYKEGEKMTNNELCILLESLLALLETNNNEKAVIVIKNAIQRIDKNTVNNSNSDNKND